MNENQDVRRSFLKQILAGAAVVVGGSALIKPARAKKILPKKGSDEILYAENENFKKYYDSLRS